MKQVTQVEDSSVIAVLTHTDGSLETTWQTIGKT